MWEALAVICLGAACIAGVVKHEQSKTGNKAASDANVVADENTPAAEKVSESSARAWLDSLKSQFGCELRCDTVSSIYHPDRTTRYTVNGRTYTGKKSLQSYKVKLMKKIPAFKSLDLYVYRDSYNTPVLAVVNDHVPTFDEFDREYDGQRFLFFFHNGEKISAMYCSEGYELGNIRLFEDITPVNPELKEQLKSLNFPL